MPNITVRDVPPEVHQVLVKRAKRRGQSLQQYLADLLAQHTSALSMDEWLDEVDELRASFDPAVDRTFDSVAYRRAEIEERSARLAGL